MSLLVAIHDVAPMHLPAIMAWWKMAVACGVNRVTFLAVPHYHRNMLLSSCEATRRFLAERAEAGDEICLHGYYHVERRPCLHIAQRVRQAMVTEGEGECLSLGPDEQNEMLVRGRAEVEKSIGGKVEGFVAPAWLEPPGFGMVLAAAGFTWHETALRVERLGPGGFSSRALPVIGFATRSIPREVSSLVWAMGAGALYTQGPTRLLTPVRLALHPDDLKSTRVVALAKRLMRRLAARRTSKTYTQALGIA